MDVKKRKSKKRSDASSWQQPKPFVLYLDRNLGNHVVANELREAGHLVEIHDDHLPIDAPDEDWIQLCSTRHWFAVTKDKNVRYRAAQKRAIATHKACVFVIRAKTATGPEIADLLVKYHGKLQRFTEHNPAPFIAGIDRSGSVYKYP